MKSPESRKQKRKTKPHRPGRGIEVIRPQVAGRDVGSREHWVSAPEQEPGIPNVKSFPTTTPGLKRLVNWLIPQGVESVAMESTSVYWIPVYEFLESRGIEVLLVNARELSQVPGRKSDLKDCQWLRLLHSCGLLRGSFRPAEATCQLRALWREDSNLQAEQTRALQRLQKALDQMNVQVHRAVSDLTGKTGLSIVRAIVEGERDPHRLAAFRDCRCRKTEAEIAEYLTGTWRSEHLFNLKMNLQRYDDIAQIRAQYEAEIQRCWAAQQPAERAQAQAPPHPNAAKEKDLTRRGEQALRTALWRLTGVDLTHIDGMGPATAQLVLSEVGPDLQSFPTEDHFASWLRLTPRLSITGGRPIRKRKNQGTGATRVGGALRMAALSLKHSDSALGAYYRRLARRKDASVAVFATARKLAILTYRMLKYGTAYVDEGVKAYEERFRQKRLHSIQNIAKSMGYQLVAVEATS